MIPVMDLDAKEDELSCPVCLDVRKYTCMIKRKQFKRKCCFLLCREFLHLNLKRIFGLYGGYMLRKRLMWLHATCSTLKDGVSVHVSV